MPSEETPGGKLTNCLRRKDEDDSKPGLPWKTRNSRVPGILVSCSPAAWFRDKSQHVMLSRGAQRLRGVFWVFISVPQFVLTEDESFNFSGLPILHLLGQSHAAVHSLSCREISVLRSQLTSLVPLPKRRL